MTTPTTADSPSPAPVNASAEEVVQAFLGALERLDYDAALSLAGKNIRWVNYPLTSSRNKAQFDKALRAMFKNATRFDVEYRDIHERGDGVVYTDRIDVFEGGGVSMNLPVQGEFRVRDGLVTEWTDKFSWPALLAQIGRSLPAVLKHHLGR
jgi:limonene-1,2-epoxide hydrolase